MNVFEDLVVELKEENLLETTFIDLPDHPHSDDSADDLVLASEEIYPRESSVPTSTHSGYVPKVEIEPTSHSIISEPDATAPDQTQIAAQVAYEDHTVEPATAHIPDNPPTPSVPELQGNDAPVAVAKPNPDREFFKKRAASEMTSLKLVDAVLSAVEREHLKVVPKTYDDLDAKRALHAFMQVADNDSSDEHKQAEFKLLRETELWCSALASRDKNVSIGHLRVYCETCKPMLSSQAMLALARFYRNLPYAETVRGKFDFIITRLFSKPREQDKRELLFTNDKMLGHVKTLYADWASIPLYSADDDDSNILLTALSFEELASEAESAESFDDLIRSDFFGRLRLFKESIAELFFAPAVTAAAIECNVRIGNIYVDLINRERLKMDVDSIHQRFSELDDQTVSEAAGRSLGLLDILRDKEISQEAHHVEHEERPTIEIDEHVEHERHRVEWTKSPDAEESSSSAGELIKRNLRSVNKFVVAFSLFLIMVSAGIFVWANYFAEPQVSTAGVKTLSFQGTDLGENVKLAKISGDTLYIVTQPTFVGATKEKQTDILQRFYQAGNEKGWSKVNLMNEQGKTIGFASSTRLEIYQP